MTPKILIKILIPFVTPFSCHGVNINYVKKNLNQNFDSLHNFIPWTLYSHNNFFYQMKVFPKVTNIHLCTNQKKIK